jgi:LmbE family N-acetylglucosaminyl deacetylase
MIMEKILVLSPHPDDDVIGCGGTIRRHIVLGDRVEVVYLTSGEKGGHGTDPGETMHIREKEAVLAADILQIPGFEFWREPDGKLKASQKNIQRLLQKIISYEPDIIYVTHEREDHQDHRTAALLVSKALKLLTTEVRSTVWMYEVWTPIQKIKHIVDITPYIEIKLQAIAAHLSQCNVLRFDEAILGLNRYRGEMHSWPGGAYAEIFTSFGIESKLSLQK